MQAGNYDPTPLQESMSNAAQSKQSQPKKNRKRNEDVFKMAYDFMRKIRDDPLIQHIETTYNPEDS